MRPVRALATLLARVWCDTRDRAGEPSEALSSSALVWPSTGVPWSGEPKREGEPTEVAREWNCASVSVFADRADRDVRCVERVICVLNDAVELIDDRRDDMRLV